MKVQEGYAWSVVLIGVACGKCSINCNYGWHVTREGIKLVVKWERSTWKNYTIQPRPFNYSDPFLSHIGCASEFKCASLV